MMKHKIVWIVISVVLLATLLACKAGGLLATATPIPTDTPLPTATPLPTDTPVPTETPVPPTGTPAPTETAEPTPTEAADATETSDNDDAGEDDDADRQDGETALEELSDGAQKFTDKTGGYTITFPDQWVVMDASEGNLEAMMDVAAENNPDLADIINNSSSMMAAGSRFFAVYYNADFISGASAPVAYTMLDKTTASFPLDTLIELNAQMLPQMLEQAEVLDSGMDENANGVEYGFIELILNVNGADGEPIKIYERMLFFQNDDNTIMTVLAANADLQDALDEIFDQIVASVEMLD